MSKNAAIMSLLKVKQLSLEDIVNPNNEASVKKEDKLEALVST